MRSNANANVARSARWFPPLRVLLATTLLACCRATPPPHAASEPARFELAAWGRIDTSEFDASEGDVAAVGDIDGDGVRDIIVGDLGPMFGVGAVHAYSGRTGGRLWKLSCPVEPKHRGCAFGWSLCSLGDVDGDGIDDFAVGDPSLGPLNGQMPPYGAWIVSSARGVVVHALVEPDIKGYGDALLSPGDIDRDGIDDLLVGWNGASSNVVDAISGKTGARIYRVALNIDRANWVTVADEDGDGVRDFIAAAGAPLVISSATGARIRSVPLPPKDLFAQHHFPVDVGDVDGDGTADDYVSRYVPHHGFARIRSGATGRTIAEFPSRAYEPLGDLDGDGQLELARTSADAKAIELYTLRRIPSATPEAR